MSIKKLASTDLQSTGLSFVDNADGTLNVYFCNRWVRYWKDTRRWMDQSDGGMSGKGCATLIDYKKTLEGERLEAREALKYGR